MKHIILVSFAIISITASFFQPGEAALETGETAPLQELADYARAEDWQLEKWEVLLKDTVSGKREAEIMTELGDVFPDQVMRITNTASHKRVQVKNRQSDTSMTEEFIAIIPANQTDKIDLMYKVTGTNQTSIHTFKQSTQFEHIQNQVLSKNVIYFSCIRVQINDIMNDVLVYEKFKEAFDITTVEKVDEGTWKSISGYTPKWEDVIPLSDNHPMNIQFAARKTLGADTTVTIGTPIITTEY
ncbi:YwmB family TATA-box binding protein [Thalassobacillus sp. CUG 92003]|uniref:YwmB family TATA-box binding protein n=1 Tax=Thalassobacillus sp. CUG 92003 TaxID=2736641 RepID=UPI0015E78885